MDRTAASSRTTAIGRVAITTPRSNASNRVDDTLYDYIRSMSGLVAYYPLNEDGGVKALNKCAASEGTLDGQNIGRNMLVNGGMEASENWVDYSSPTTNERSTTYVHDGNYSRKIVVDASNKGAMGVSTYITIGHTYKVGCYVYTKTGSTGRARIRRNTAKIDYTLTGSTTGEWELLTATVVAGASGTDTMRLEASGAGEFYFDGAFIEDLGVADNRLSSAVGVKGKAYRFDGVNDYVELPNNDVFSPANTGSFAVFMLMTPEVLDFTDSLAMGGDEGGAVHFLGKYESSAAEYYFRMYNKTGSSRPNRISFYVFEAAGGEGIGGYFQDTLVAGQTMLLIASVDGQYVSIYKNGVLRQSTDYTIDQGYAGPLTLSKTTSPVRFGTTALNVSDFGWFKGKLQHVGFLNRAITQEEATRLASLANV